MSILLLYFTFVDGVVTWAEASLYVLAYVLYVVILRYRSRRIPDNNSTPLPERSVAKTLHPTAPHADVDTDTATQRTTALVRL